MSTQLERLSEVTKVVADTGDFESIRAFQPVDATTNPSLMYWIWSRMMNSLKASLQPEYSGLVSRAIEYGKVNMMNEIDRIGTWERR